MAEEDVEGTEPVEDPDEDASVAALAVDMGGNRMVPLSALMDSKKESKAHQKRIKELEPIAGRVTDMEGKLEQASPIISAILNNPKLKAEALRIVNGTRASSEATDQPEDDDDATAFAEDSGFYLSDGASVDVARGRRVLDRLDKRHGRQTDAKVGKVAGAIAGDRAAVNEREIYAAADEDGTPLATQESIKETIDLLGGDGRRLLADPRVKQMVIIQAAGLDRLRGRTPKAPDEPVYLSGAGSGRRRASEAIDADMRGFLERQGISEKDYLRSQRNLVAGVGDRANGIKLGGK